MVLLKGHVQRYEWGKKGPDSLVAQLAKASGVLKSIEADSPYAELWFGSHPSGPSTTTDGSIFKQPLPFLLKVLSVGKALSIQAHPDLELARRINRERPDLYRDGNHKPEMAIALTPFEALVGFRPLVQIDSFLKKYPVLQQLTGTVCVESEEDLKRAFGNLMRAQITDNDLKTLKIHDGDKDDKEGNLFERLKKEYPGDIGCFCVFFLNYLRLEVGQAVFLGPNEPHAYLSGDCIECMANSDNVVRAGLTPKYRDVDLLLQMLTYKSHEPSALIINNNDSGGVYETPVKEFNVVKYEEERVAEAKIRKPAILLVIKGTVCLNGKELNPGDAAYISKGEIVLTSNGPFLVFKAEEQA